MAKPGGEPGPVGSRQPRFRTTRWSLVLRARSGDARHAREALAALCEVYWYPLYAFVRRKGHDAESAQDLVQGFLARLLERNDLAAVDRRKGRFRSFLMAACSHYLSNHCARERAARRGGGRTPISIDRLQAEGQYQGHPADDLTPERVFERQWALTLLDHVLEKLEAEMARSGKQRQFATLRPALLGSAEKVPYARLAAELGISEEAARAAARRLRQRYREILRDEVAQTLDDPADVEGEILALFATLGR